MVEGAQPVVDAPPDEPAGEAEDEAEAAPAGKRPRGRPKGSRNKRSRTVSSKSARPKRQATLFGGAVPERAAVTVLNPGQRSASSPPAAERSGDAGRKLDWVHAHRVPVDDAPFEELEGAERQRAMLAANAWMLCSLCGEQHRYRPSTAFKEHLLGLCQKFKDSEHWQSPTVQADAAKRQSEARI